MLYQESEPHGGPTRVVGDLGQLRQEPASLDIEDGHVDVVGEGEVGGRDRVELPCVK